MHDPTRRWGKGFVITDRGGRRFDTPASITWSDDGVEVVHDLGGLTLSVRRRVATTWTETYELRNGAAYPLTLGSIAVSTPWRDVYGSSRSSGALATGRQGSFGSLGVPGREVMASRCRGVARSAPRRDRDRAHAGGSGIRTVRPGRRSYRSAGFGVSAHQGHCDWSELPSVIPMCGCCCRLHVVLRAWLVARRESTCGRGSTSRWTMPTT
jgi:hypothetical protein